MILMTIADTSTGTLLSLSKFTVLHWATHSSSLLPGAGVAGLAGKFYSPLPSPPGFPERVELAPLSPWQPVGKNLTLRCWVAGGEPRTHLSVLLLRGEEELSRQQAVGEPAEVTTTVLASRDNHGANFSCRSELDLRPQGLGLFQNSSAPRQLRTFGEGRDCGQWVMGWAKVGVLGPWGS